MKVREDDFRRSDFGWAHDDPEVRPAPPRALTPKPGKPLTSYRDSGELLASMSAARRANLAKLAKPAPPEDPAAFAGAAARRGRMLGWSVLLALAGMAAAGAARNRRRSK
ncbi:hypothetical protein [Phenylobacterium sp.]|jgi:hypothetical protein|uniref:hypothetical protein n=1 Tax=Phenylobacterium sp. TaxID=1871053 RepID=UPI002E2FDA88|nr:hypothetical protein [Phenylobacterium sp.]HEX2559398.1 hypothetical protein [Phenylobacterium sp.]